MEDHREFNVLISGQAGQGIETIGEALARLFKDSGFFIFANRDYMSRIRGGNNYVQLRISTKPVHSPREKVDVVFCLDAEAVTRHSTRLAPGGVIVADLKKFGFHDADNRYFDLPLYDLATRIGGSALYVNTVGLGVLAAISNRPFSLVEQVIKDTFRHKSDEIITKNSAVALAAYDKTMDNRERFSRLGFEARPQLPGQRQILMNGHEAVTLGAIKAGCKFYSGYPMTPSTGILELIAKYAGRFGIIVEQAEDEIAAINMVIGASFAGVRAMTATSGGGFCLMTEGLALAAMTETPVVIVVGQRPGPATGFPTRTSQDCLNFVLHAGHGEFTRAVFSPGTVEEGFYLTIKAFNLAEKYQLPSIILTDQAFADSYANLPPFDTEKEKVRRSVISRVGDMQDYKRYQQTDSGISPRAVPSWIDGVAYADSDEHNDDGHITEEGDIARRNVEKRLYAKFGFLCAESEKPVAGNLEGADVILLGFGSTYGVTRDVADSVKSFRVGYIHLPQVWPFPAEQLRAMLSGAKKVLSIENNAEAQLAQLLFRETGIETQGSILKYDGRPFFLEEVIHQVERAHSEAATPLEAMAARGIDEAK